jgi:hypothetical protein
MTNEQLADSPFHTYISFHVLIEHLERVALEQTGYAAERAKALLSEIEPYPELREGLTDERTIEKYITVIENLLADLFPAALSNNEIKAVTIPFQNFIINKSNRLKKILDEAGPAFDMSIRDFDVHQFYVLSCCLILNEFYNTQLDFGKPMFYDIPNSAGIIKHYRILYNADFLDIVPTEKAVSLTKDDITQLVNNYDDLSLWKRFFPPGSYILKGFAILSLYDATIENAVSALKGTLITSLEDVDVEKDFESIFRSIYKIPDLQIGFTAFNAEENTFTTIVNLRKIKSFMLNQREEALCTDVLGPKSYKAIMGTSDYFAISDCKQFLLEHPDSELSRQFLNQNLQSFILAPVVKNDVLLGVLELASARPYELNSVNARKLEVVMPFLVDTIDRQITNSQNQEQAIIQNEYTTLHPSVQWKFRKEAQRYIEFHNQHKEYVLKEIVFEEVYPLYGQIDIKGSSDCRNQSIQMDLDHQLNALIKIVANLQGVKEQATTYLQELTDFKELTVDGALLIRADKEQYIQYYIESYIHPLLKERLMSETHGPAIRDYFAQLDKNTGSFHINRRKYDVTVSTINQKMSSLLDERQVAAQQMFPHYYERFKTDGVEHNLYIGASIVPNQLFSLKHFHALRLWQLQVLCEMERKHHKYKASLPYPLDVTTLILAYSSPLSIRFRMDEKRFDVDGSYNARFEIVKKRIDKAYIKDTHERITQPGKVAIVYASYNEEKEYIGYIEQLQTKGILHHDIEMLEVEDLQSVSGLKALRVAILHH